MATSTLLRFLVVGIFLAIKSQIAFAVAQLQQGDTDSRSHAALIVYEMMGDFYELKYENKQMAEKIARLEENQESVENAADEKMINQANKIETLEASLQLQETSVAGQSEKIRLLEDKLKSQENYATGQSEKIVELEGIIESVETSSEETLGILEKQIESLEEALNLQKNSAVGQSEKIKILEDKLKSQETSSVSQTEKIEKLEDKMESLEDQEVGQLGAIKTLEEKLESLEDYTKGMRSAFTVTHPVQGSETNAARFTNAVTNIGGHYSTSTGVFTSENPGIYVFSLTILKMSAAKYANCQIRKNRSYVAHAHSHPSTVGSGYFSSSTSVILHLVRGDIVDVYCGSGVDSININYSFFSGFLNKAD